jgi:putative two-component system response regulator
MNEQEKRPVVLAVDDTPENLDVVKGLLTPKFVVKAAVNGMMALKIVEKQSPDLILLDIRMPGMDGFEVCRRLKENDASADIPVVFLTGESDPEIEADALAAGAAGFITKPIDPATLFASIEKCLNKSTKNSVR